MKKINEVQNVPPVVAVLGHVDHGKTTLLDAIRKTSIANREFGGITQAIGASSIEINHEGLTRKITFIDTPGHEAFAKMRGRGAQAADIGLLITSLVDGVMPQTKESIAILKEAGIPIIAVLTMSDREGVNPEKVKGQLNSSGISLESLGGDVPEISVSAKTGTNVKELLDLILLVWDIQSKKPSRDSKFSGVVIESRQDPKAGPKATAIVKAGKISLRDEIVTESTSGKVRSLIDTFGKMQKEVGVGEAIEILGFEEAPKTGEILYKKGEKEKTDTSKQEAAEQGTNEGILSLILISDNLGSLEAIRANLPQGVKIMKAKTGEVTPADVLFAKSTSSLILTFKTRIKPEIVKMGQLEKVLVKNYNLIYEMFDEIKDAVEGKEFSMQEEILGAAKILAEFPFEKTKVMGVSVTDGRIAKGDKIRLIRGEEEKGDATISSLRKGKEVISKAEKGEEAGIIATPFLDFEIGDMIISHS